MKHNRHYLNALPHIQLGPVMPMYVINSKLDKSCKLDISNNLSTL